MRQTALKRCTPLKRTRLKHKPKRFVNITPETIAAVNQRANASVGVGRCEDCGKLPDFRGLAYCEPIKGMGGCRRQFTADEVKRKCYPCHNKHDHGINEVRSAPQWSKKPTLSL